MQARATIVGGLKQGMMAGGNILVYTSNDVPGRLAEMASAIVTDSLSEISPNRACETGEGHADIGCCGKRIIHFALSNYCTRCYLDSDNDVPSGTIIGGRPLVPNCENAQVIH